LKTIGTYILVVFGLFSNACSIAGLWFAYTSAPAEAQHTFWRFLLSAAAVASAAAYLAVAWLLISRTKQSEASTSELRASEQRITALEQRLDQQLLKKESALPSLRPKVVPVKFGRTPDSKYGLFVRNDGEPALDLSLQEPIQIGTAKLKFWERTYPGLTKEQGELLVDAEIELSQGHGLTASALRDQMIKADLEAITLTIRYRDLDNRHWITTFDVVREFWEHGLRIASVKQEFLTSAVQ
jgi:hypothetical protein